jgi:hypothetical protein
VTVTPSLHCDWGSEVWENAGSQEDYRRKLNSAGFSGGSVPGGATPQGDRGELITRNIFSMAILPRFSWVAACLTVMIVIMVPAGAASLTPPPIDGMVVWYFGKPPDRLGAEAKTQILGRWFTAYGKDIDTKEIARHPASYEFCDFRSDGTAGCATSEGLCRCEIRIDRIIVSCDGKERYPIFRVDGKFYIPSHEQFFVPLIRLPAENK